MKFILLVHHDETAFEKMSEETKKGLLTESIGFCHQLDAKGEYVHASPVHPASAAALVRVRDGRSLVTDGPFIETREQMAGYFLIEAKDRAEAVAIDFLNPAVGENLVDPQALGTEPHRAQRQRRERQRGEQTREPRLPGRLRRRRGRGTGRCRRDGRVHGRCLPRRERPPGTTPNGLTNHGVGEPPRTRTWHTLLKRQVL